MYPSVSQANRMSYSGNLDIVSNMLLLSKTVKKKQDFDVHNKKGYKKNKGMKMSFFNVEL